ncbi:MAG: aminoacyl-tRNA hydrolase [Chloroflexi bacterium]|nr:aminoacyl-tRNA hydrolase [Chloroflexota bacterium]
MSLFSRSARPRQVPPGPALHLIVGLGNPGPKYAQNRHNVGFRLLDRLVARYALNLSRRRFQARLGEGRICGHRVILAKPQTFMNESGRAVAAISRWYKIPPQRILVLHDDLDLPLAKVRLRSGGSSGGHNGIKSIIAELGSEDFARLRVGIGRLEHGDPIDYVLDSFTPEQETLIEALFPWVDEIVCCFLDRGIHAAMNEYNGRDLASLNAGRPLDLRER